MSEFDIAESGIDNPDYLNVVVEDQEPEPQQKPRVKKKVVPAIVRAKLGDSYISLGQQYFPKRKNAATEIMALNNGRPIREGTKVFLP